MQRTWMRKSDAGSGVKSTGNGANDNYKAWRRIKLNMDTFVENSPVDTSTELFGRAFAVSADHGTHRIN